MLARPGTTLLVLLLASIVASPGVADKPVPPRVGAVNAAQTTFVRVRRAGGDAIAMDTAVVRFTPADPADGPRPVVDLIGAVHVGDGAYYQRLNRLFENYDVVLYELVAEPNTRPKADDDEGTNPLRMLQLGMREMLDLEFQLEKIDYQAANLVHADLSPAELSQAWTDSGDSIFALLSRIMSYSNSQAMAGAGVEAELLVALLSADGRSTRLKRILATQFENLDDSMQAIEGPNGSALIGARNQRVMDELARQVELGRRRIGIFYGAGHMPDLAARLAARGLQRRTTVWLPAWDMTSE